MIGKIIIFTMCLAVDGDSLKCDGRSIRLYGIDAAELRQECRIERRRYPCGLEAKKALQRAIQGRRIKCRILDKHFERLIAICEADGKDLARIMVRAGWAVNYERYGNGLYGPDEGFAQRNQKGMHRGMYELPWQWRRR